MKVEISSVSIIKSSLTPNSDLLSRLSPHKCVVFREGGPELRETACVCRCVSSHGGHSQSRQLQDLGGLMAAAPQIRQFT